MRISDWSSDVCSSDLALPRLLVRRCIAAAAFDADAEFHFGDRAAEVALDVGREGFQRRNIARVEPVRRVWREIDEARQKPRYRKRVGEGKSVSLRVDLGERRIIRTKTT